jgi:uncharacterized membrane protein
VSGSIPSVIVGIAAVATATLVTAVMRRRRGQSLNGRFFVVGAVLIAAAILLSLLPSGLALPPHALGKFLAAALLAGATFLGWYAFRTWQVQGWSPLVRQLAFTIVTTVASAIACLYFL